MQSKQAKKREKYFRVSLKRAPDEQQQSTPFAEYCTIIRYRSAIES